MGRTRRELLTACTAVTAASALAGCSGGGDGSGGTRDGNGDGGGDGDGTGGGFPSVADYRSSLRQELDITIARLEVQDGTVLLAYESGYQTDTAEWGYEVGFISARFGRFVADGWDVDTLSGRVTASDGRTLGWEVSAETARAFVADEVTVDEFVERIFESMTER